MSPKHHYPPLSGGDRKALIKEADNLLCQSWNEKIWANGGPAINCGYPWLEIECSRCKTKRDVNLAALKHVNITLVHDYAGRLRGPKCDQANKRPMATLLQLQPRPHHSDEG
jgi:hypothetical protein